MRDSVVFYRSFYEAIKELSAEDFKSCVEAIMEYGLNEIEPSSPGIAKAIFIMAKPQIDANNRRYENGNKGGRPITKANQDETKDNQTITKANQSITKQKPKQENQEPKEKVKEKDNVKDKDNVKVNDNAKEKVKVKEEIYSVRFCELWEAYPRKKEKSKAYKCFNARINDGYSEDELITAVKRYAAQCRAQKTEERFIKLPATFLGANTPFVDYLGENYKEPLSEHEKYMRKWEGV